MGQGGQLSFEEEAHFALEWVLLPLLQGKIPSFVVEVQRLFRAVYHCLYVCAGGRLPHLLGCCPYYDHYDRDGKVALQAAVCVLAFWPVWST